LATQTHNHKITITLDPEPVDGAWLLNIGAVDSTYLAYNISTTDLLAAITAMTSVGTGNATVSQVGTFSWAVTFIAGKQHTNMGAITGDPAALVVPVGRKGTLSFNTDGALIALKDKSAIPITIEADFVPNGSNVPSKILRQDGQLLESVIDPASIGPTPRLNVLGWEGKDNSNNNDVLAAGHQYLADTTAAAFSLKLPPAPVANDTIVIADKQGTWATNNLTIDRNGNNIEGAAANLICNVSDQFTIVWVAGAKGWKVYA
jgi:hypothetical protein